MATEENISVPQSIAAATPETETNSNTTTDEIWLSKVTSDLRLLK